MDGNDTKIKNEFKILNKTEDMAEMYLYGTIDKDNKRHKDEEVITSKLVREALNDIKSSTINVHIKTNGGDSFESTAIHNLLKQHKAYINIYIDSIAASGGSIIAMAGDKIFMPKNAMMMIHKAWTFTCGNSSELLKVSEDLKKIDSSIKENYKNRFVGTDEELEKLIEDETLLTADECKVLGFCDEVINDEEKTEVKKDVKSSILNKYRIEEKQSIISKWRSI